MNKLEDRLVAYIVIMFLVSINGIGIAETYVNKKAPDWFIFLASNAITAVLAYKFPIKKNGNGEGNG